MGAIISRFAPAPTGYLHLGHVVNAVHVWRETRARNGRVLLRIEDHDRQRIRPEFEAAMLEDLEWLGFAPDEPPVRQSERGDLYEQALDGLRERGLVYACACTRAEIGAAEARAVPPLGARAVQASGQNGEPERLALHENELRYPGTCADLGLAERHGLGLRVCLEPSVERFVDLRHGPQTQRPSEQCGDLLLRDRDGNWTYQFAATVDDDAQGVTLVIRGDDLLASTGRQMQLARLLGRAEPAAFLHHPLIMKSPTQKLSKSDGDTGIRALRARGWTPGQVIDAAMSAVSR
jgi:glutamyl-tRNA synthetase/glutamyl-Q tRNA(Asp) synthetase